MCSKMVQISRPESIQLHAGAAADDLLLLRFFSRINHRKRCGVRIHHGINMQQAAIYGNHTLSADIPYTQN